MIIGYDGKRAIENFTGLGNYSRLLVTVLAEHYPENEYLLFAPRIKPNTRMRRLMELRNVDLRVPALIPPKKISGSFWRTRGLTDQLRSCGVNLYHGLSGELPANIRKFDGPTVLTIHDLIFRRFPSGYHPIDRRIYDHKFARSCRDATRIIAISERTRRDIIELYDIPAEKIDVVYQGCAAQFKRTPSEAEIERVKAKYDLRRPYVIAVGTVESRKNQQLAVMGMSELAGELDLVIVGHRTSYGKTLDALARSGGVSDKVKFLEGVDFTLLPALYAGAVCSSYTSRYEGFGIPVIESLSVGTPVVIATGSCLEEAAGPSAPTVDPDAVEEWVAAVKEIYDDPVLRNRIAFEGHEYVSRFTDEAMAAYTMKTYLRAIEEYGR